MNRSSWQWRCTICGAIGDYEHPEGYPSSDAANWIKLDHDKVSPTGCKNRSNFNQHTITVERTA